MMMVHNFRTAIFISVLLASSECRAKEVTVTSKSEPEVYTLTFDDRVISKAQMQALLRISPHPGEPNPSLAPSVESCIPNDPRYFPCGPFEPKTALSDIDDPNFLKNAQVNLEIGRQQMAQLKALKYPKELEPVWRYEESYLELTLWLEETKYEFYQSWDVEVLKRRYEDFDPSQTCAASIAEIEAAQSKQEKHRLAHFDWHNCVLDTFLEAHHVQYPIDAWEQFLKAYGIKEKFEVDVD